MFLLFKKIIIIYHDKTIHRKDKRIDQHKQVKKDDVTQLSDVREMLIT